MTALKAIKWLPLLITVKTKLKIPITDMATPTSFWAFFIFYLNILHKIIIKKNKLLKELTNIVSLRKILKFGNFFNYFRVFAFN